MINFTFNDAEGRTNLGVGISRENVRRILDGQPLVVNLIERGIPRIDGKVMVYFGETERELQNAVAEFIGPDTKVHIDPKLKSKLD